MIKSVRRVQLATALLIAVLSSLVAIHLTNAKTDFGQPVVGQHIYDRAGVLTPEQVAELELRAQAVEAAGAPVVVFLQAEQASYDQTEQDARDLMDAWDVQSAPNAHDGLVLFFNLKPDDLFHGEAVLFAGERHYKSGNLPERELQRIFNQEMRPLLTQGDLAEGISAGLVAAEASLRNGPPPPPKPTAVQRLAADASRGIFSIVNVIAVLISGVYLWFTSRVWRERPRSSAPIVATLDRPDRQTPATVGALVSGHIRDAQIEATILELARRGALAIEPSGEKKAQIRMIDGTHIRDEVENVVWSSLATRAGKDGVIPNTDLQRVRGDWGEAKQALRHQLEDAGWFDPSAGSVRRPIYIGAVGLLVLALPAFFVTVIGQQPWGFLGTSALATAGLSGIIAMLAYPDTTPSGIEAAASWRSYIAGIKRSKSDPALGANLDLDEVMPYAVAAGVSSSLDRRLKQATEEGYDPAWLGPTHYHNVNLTGGNAYIYWVAFHAAMTPSTSGGAAGGGASAGGGGAGGSF